MPRSISDRQFLETRVQNKKVELTVLKNTQTTSNAVYDNAKAMLIAEIDAIEEQLSNSQDNKTSYPERDSKDIVVVNR